MIFSALKALTGDSFVIVWNDNALLIDGGMPNTYNFIRDKLSGKNLKAVFITHVDYDHIGGIINMIKADEVEHNESKFYMNSPDLAAHYNGSEVRYSHGDTLDIMLNALGHKFLPMTNTLDPITIDGLKITTLLPSEDTCITLCENWNASRIIEDGTYSYLKRQKNNGDIINKSSIVLVLEYHEARVLMLGDSHPDDVVGALVASKYKKFNMVKLSHHGSSHNTNKALLDEIECNKYFISTNGNIHEHPHSETIKLLSDRAVALEQVFSIYLNYDIEDEIRNRCQFKIKNLNFTFQQDVEL
jgi:beta-lactamase superfamily II metal-dependent hydrolase